VRKLPKKHDFDAAWKSILEAFEIEIVEMLFPEIFSKVDWNLGTESLNKELQEIQKDIFDKDSSEHIISDKIIKVKLKNKESKILFIHVEVQSYSSKNDIFGERMFRYFYRIWDKFRYKHKDRSEIVAAAIYTYKGDRGKDKKYVYNLPELDNDILVYNFRTIDVEKINFEDISNDNPLKLVFKMAKSLLETGVKDKDIFEAKINLAEELKIYDKVKNNDQIKALVDFLEYLFLIKDPKLEKKFDEYKKRSGGAFKMTIEEIRKTHYKQVGREEGRQEGRQEGREEGAKLEKIKTLKNLKNLGLDDKTIMKALEVDEEEYNELSKLLGN
jgi:predicted transposase/invertase (TIGR01784 family)